MSQHLFAYIFAIFSILGAILFFKIWHKGAYMNVVMYSLLIRIVLIPFFDIYRDKIFPAEIPELLQWYEEWIKYSDLNGYFNILLKPFDVEGPRGMYLYYSMYAGWLLRLTDTNDFIPLRIVTAVISLTVVVFSYKFCKLIYKKKPTNMQMFVITNWPFWLLYSVNLGRTMPSVLIPLFGMLYLYKLIQRFSVFTLIIVTVSFWLTLIFRTFYSFFFVTTLLSYLLYIVFLEKKWHENKIKKIAGISLIIVLSIICSKYFSILDAFSLITDDLSNGDQVNGDATGSSYLLNFFPTQLSDLLYYVPIQGLYFLFSPMIWDVLKLEQLISSIFALSLFFFIIRVLIIKNSEFKRSKIAKVFLLNMILICMVLGAGVKNAGAAQRWRLPVTVILLCIVLIDNVKNDERT